MRDLFAKVPQALGFFGGFAVMGLSLGFIGLMGLAVGVTSCAKGDSPGGSEEDGGAGGSPDGGGDDSNEADDASDSETGNPSCGNGVVDHWEDCEGTDLNGKTCLTESFGSGTLSCTDECTFDTSKCGPPCESIDLGTWVGETITRDGDGLCSGTSLYDGKDCTGVSSNGGESVYAVTVPGHRAIRATVTSDDYVFSVWASTFCADFKSAECVDGVGDSGVRPIDIANDGDEPRTYYIVVDANQKADCRDFKLEVSGDIPEDCGNGSLDPGEECDGDLLDGKSCKDLGYKGGLMECTLICSIDNSDCRNAPPPEWECDPSAWGEYQGCDCGCGAFDPDCDNTTRGACHTCDGDGSCASECLDIKQTQNWLCREPAYCGDGTIDPGEVCDGTNLGGASCQTRGFVGGTLLCSSTCEFNLSGCHRCGNGTIDTSEQCDGEALGGSTCESLGYHMGSLGCRSNCTFDVAECVGEAPIQIMQGCDPTYCTSEDNAGPNGGHLCHCKILGSAHPRSNWVPFTDLCVDYGFQPIDGAGKPTAPFGGQELVVKIATMGYNRFSASTCVGTLGNQDSDSSVAAFDANPTDLAQTHAMLLACNADAASQGSLCSNVTNVYGSATPKPTRTGTTGELWLVFDSYYDYEATSYPYRAIPYWDRATPREFEFELFYDPCGNGIIDGSEECDGNDLGGETCATIGMGFSGGNLNCTQDCTLDTTACSLCGNGSIDTASGEVCDGSLLDGQTCETLGYAGDKPASSGLTCRDDCRSFDDSNCVGELPVESFDNCPAKYCSWTAGAGPNKGYLCSCTLNPAEHPRTQKYSNDSLCSMYGSNGGGPDLHIRIDKGSYLAFSASTCVGSQQGDSSLAVFDFNPAIASGSALDCNGDTTSQNYCSKLKNNPTGDPIPLSLSSVSSSEIWLVVASRATGTYWNGNTPRQFQFELVAPPCGDGVIGVGEQCDGDQLGGRDCNSLGYSGGTLSCLPNCLYNYNACTGGGVPLASFSGCDERYCEFRSGLGPNKGDLCTCIIPGSVHPVDNNFTGTPCAGYGSGPDLIISMPTAGYTRFSASTCNGTSPGNSSIAAFDQAPGFDGDGVTLLGCNADAQNSWPSYCSKIKDEVGSPSPVSVGSASDLFLVIDSFASTGERYWDGVTTRQVDIEMIK